MKYLKKFELVKENFTEEVQINLLHLSDEGFSVDIETTEQDEKYFIRVWLPKITGDSYSYEGSKDFEYSKISDEICRMIQIIESNCEVELIYVILSETQDFHWCRSDGFGFKRKILSVDEVLKGINIGVIKCLAMRVIVSS